MDKLRRYLGFKTSSSVLFSSTRIFSKLPSWLWHKPKGHAHATLGANKQGTNGKGLVSLNEDMELCAGYADIEIMWKMIHSTCSSKDARSTRNCKRPRYSVFCFRPS